ncbi:MAG: glutamate racemase [Syntrophomonadaceae bacterium]
MGDSRPIGIFDSGVGGLTVVRSLIEKLPLENFIYFGDTAHVPYGNKSEQELMYYAREIISFLLKQEVKAIIVACGTHSSITLPRLMYNYSIPIIGVVDAAAICAAGTTSNGKIGVAATQATVKSQAYTNVLLKLNPDYKVYEVACPDFVPLVESGKLEGGETLQAVADYLGYLLDFGIDTLVLGCTHYPFLLGIIEKYVGEEVNVIDPSCKTVEQVKDILLYKGLLNSYNPTPLRKFYVSGRDDSFFNVGRLLIGNTIKEVIKVKLD